MFSVGQEVECIKENWISHIGPKIGEKVTITGIFTKTFLWFGIGTYLRLKEYPEHIGYIQDHFHAIQKKKTDISVFTAMLTKAPEHV